VTQFCDITLG